jgi:excinuclease ABC subunit B
MQRALKEISRRRIKQLQYNEKNNIKPKSIIKAVTELNEFRNLSRKESLAHIISEEQFDYKITPKNIASMIKKIEGQMKEAADNLDFESAAILRDKVRELKNMKSYKFKAN